MNRSDDVTLVNITRPPASHAETTQRCARGIA